MANIILLNHTLFSFFSQKKQRKNDHNGIMGLLGQFCIPCGETSLVGSGSKVTIGCHMMDDYNISAYRLPHDNNKKRDALKRTPLYRI